MDASKEYIKMCEKAAEIQKFKEFNEEDELYAFVDGDIIANVYPIPIVFSNSHFDEHLDYDVIRRAIWLPRQDQLQGLCGNMFPPYTNMIKNVTYHCAGNEAYWDCFDSGEQFWLAYYMATKQDKHWNGADWIKN